jgi:aldehyde:ferredoxin oxidoreductase
VQHIKWFNRSFDYPPPRFMEEPVQSGPNKGRFIPLEIIDAMLDEYYDLRGWDNNGIPTVETLKRFGLAK